MAAVDADWAWAEHALCKGTPTDMWYPPTGDSSKWSSPALASSAPRVPDECRVYCDACPVRADCHRHALRHERHGIWAATTEHQRHLLRRAAGIRLDDEDTNKLRDRVVVERIVHAYWDGEPVPAIAAYEHMTERNVYRILHDAGVDTDRNPDHWAKRTPTKELA